MCPALLGGELYCEAASLSVPVTQKPSSLWCKTSLGSIAHVIHTQVGTDFELTEKRHKIIDVARSDFVVLKHLSIEKFLQSDPHFNVCCQRPGYIIQSIVAQKLESFELTNKTIAVVRHARDQRTDPTAVVEPKRQNLELFIQIVDEDKPGGRRLL